MDDKPWNATVLSKDRQRLVDGRIDELFFEHVLMDTRELDLLSTRYFPVDGTLVEAWARQSPVDSSGKRRTNRTKQSTTPTASPSRTGGGTGAGRTSRRAFINSGDRS